MVISRLDHISIRTTDVQGTCDFYARALDLHSGDRPPFPFPGAWLYCADRAVIHIIGIDPGDTSGLEDYLEYRDPSSLSHTGAFDHVAFASSDFEATQARLRAADIPFREREVPMLAIKQLFIDDPNGVTVELNFSLDG